MKAKLNDLMIHIVGNKSQDQELFLSEKAITVDEEVHEKLCNYFLNRFEHVFEHYEFDVNAQSDLIHSEAKTIFKDPTVLTESSKKIARHLYNCSTHPRIKPGELYITLINGFHFEGKFFRALGIFKTELKNGFFEVNRSASSIQLSYREGIDLNKFDKGCIILESSDEGNPIVLIIDHQSRGDEAIYWRGDFLGLRQRFTSFSMTTQVMNSTKEFVSDFLDKELELSKAEKIDLLNRSGSYFRTNELFQSSGFEKTVLEKPDFINSYRKYCQEKMASDEPFPNDNFSISAHAVRQQTRIFKSVLKLDRNFHIYIHGNRNLIERGIDPDGRKFYKVYFENET